MYDSRKSTSRTGSSPSSAQSDDGHDQEIIEYNNGLTLINHFLPPEAYHVLLETIKEDFRELEETKRREQSTIPQNHDTINPSITPKNSQPKAKPKLRRQAIHYGPKYDYTTNHACPNSIPNPTYIQNLIERIKPHIRGLDINQATIQYYPPGSGIPPHIDTHSCFEDEILSFSLGAGVNMGFQRGDWGTREKMFAPRRCAAISTSTSNSDVAQNTSGSNGNATGQTTHSSTPSTSPKPSEPSTYHEIHLPPNSLCIMSNEIRYAWTHGIRSRATDDGIKRGDRYSITFRKVDFEGVCACQYGVWCDSQQGKSKD
nr:hypothetical protein I302_07587 [Kwoniella bestiolae CBS 10118]OCF23233.1 hypothetical protein I302_07587 [Kwoniella bestiolae CBS 10118]